MFLNSLILHNFRKFENLELHFNERLSVLVGNNGTGKSTILEAATIAAGTFTSAMDGLTNYGIRKTDAHYKYFKMGSVIDVQPQFPVSISAQGDMMENVYSGKEYSIMLMGAARLLVPKN